MFGARQFGKRMFAARFFGPAVAGGTPPPSSTVIQTPVKTTIFRKVRVVSEIETR
jgi:hypothetical protein